MLTGHKFRLYPNQKEQAILRLWIGHQRFIYNAKTQEQDYWFKFYKNSLALTGLSYYPDQSYSQFRNDELTPWLNLVPPEILRNGSYKYMTAYKRFAQGLAGTPNRKKAFGRQSVMITSELFSFDDNANKQSKNHTINIGNKKFPVGNLQFKAHKQYNLPKSITISVNPSGHWFISFNSDEVNLNNQLNSTIIRSQEELMYEFSLRKDLDKIVLGLDRGVVLPVATSDNSNYSIDDKILKRIAKKEIRAKRYQRKLSRQQSDSKNRNKTKQKIGKLKQYQTNVRQDFSHKTSYELVNGTAEVFVLENLKLKNLMAAPKPKQDSKGKYIQNGRASKAGLNKSLANSSLGLIKQFINYKAAKRNKLVLNVNPAYSSQECSECHFAHKDNRLSQSVFKCTSCGYEENADSNAAKIIKYRGIEFLKSFDLSVYKPKSKKTVRIRKKVGKVLPEPIPDYLESKPVENMLDMEDINLSAVQRSMNQETPTKSICFSGE